MATGPEEQKLGLQGSSTRQLLLDGARIPADRLLGEIGRGHKIAFNILNVGRFKLGGGALGAARECLRFAVDYGRERKQFGRPIVEFGMVQRKIADMATRLYVADSMAYRTAGLLDSAVSEVPASGPAHDAGMLRVLEEYTVECSILKVFGTECLDFVADESLQMLGGYGFLRDYPIERHYRDSRVNRIFEGTNEVNRLIIPATLLKRAGRGQVAYFAFVESVQREIAAGHVPAAPGDAPLEADTLVVEQSKKITAWAAQLLVSRNLKDLAERQQHLEILANMVIDVFAAESAVARTRKLMRARGAAGAVNNLDMTRVFVASANERIADGARRLAANELVGAELDAAMATIDRLQVRLPIVTIAAKTRIAERIVAGDVEALTETL